MAENGWLPKKPFRAESGEGCAACTIGYCMGVISSALRCAALPQSTKTTGLSFPFTLRMTASVKRSKPLQRCEFGACARHREYGVEQHALCSLRDQISVVGDAAAKVIPQLDEDVLERWRRRDAQPHGEAQPVRLSRLMI